MSKPDSENGEPLNATLPDGLPPDAGDAAPPDNDAPPPPPPVDQAAPLPVASMLPDGHLTPLEERIRRLEAELDRLHVQNQHLPQAAPLLPVASIIAAPPDKKQGSFLGNLGQRLWSASGPVQALKPAAESALIPPSVRRTWMLVDAVTEVRAILRMYVDPRYRMSLFGWLTPLVLAAAVITSGFWAPFAGVLVFGTLVDKVIDLILCFALFKLLSYEARRYRETAPDLPPHLRL